METRRMTPDDEDFTAERLEGDVLRLEDARDRREQAKAPPWRPLSAFVSELDEIKDDPWVSLRLVDEELCRVRVGGMVVLIGGPGSGKSSLCANLLIDHATNVGPAIAASIELPGVELAGRVVGIRCDASWEEALTGKVPAKFVADALAIPRFFVLERKRATLANLASCIEYARQTFPNQPILVAIDYAQLIPGKGQEQRQRVSDVFEQIDDLCRATKVVSLVLSQMGRAGAAAARSGEKLGAETADLGAESSAIERFATSTITIGMKGEPREDGSQAVELSVGKARMGVGDRVVPMSYTGRSGLWRVDGESKSAAKVREERDAEAEARADRSVELQLVGAAQRANGPLSREQLMDLVTGRKEKKRKAITHLLSSGELVEVARRASRSRSWAIWTKDRAEAGGVKLARDAEQGDLL